MIYNFNLVIQGQVVVYLQSQIQVKYIMLN